MESCYFVVKNLSFLKEFNIRLKFTKSYVKLLNFLIWIEPDTNQKHAEQPNQFYTHAHIYFNLHGRA